MWWFFCSSRTISPVKLNIFPSISIVGDTAADANIENTAKQMTITIFTETPPQEWHPLENQRCQAGLLFLRDRPH